MNSPSPGVFVTGATGFVGRKLVPALVERGWRVVALTRDAARARAAYVSVPGADAIEWTQGDASVPGDWTERLRGCRAVIALAGEPIFEERWNEKVKARLVDSRVGAAKLIVRALGDLPKPDRPGVFLSASSYGWYPDRGSEVQDEDSSQPGNDFLARLSIDWEQAVGEAARLEVRIVHLRFGLVLGHDGGLLAGLVPRFRAFLGGAIGDGRQYVPMIHADDAVALMLLGLGRDDVAGPVNLAMPDTPTMRTFAKAVGRALHRPSWLRLPALVVRLKLGEVSAAVLGSRRVMPARALSLGYRFRFPTIDAALSDLLGDAGHTKPGARP